MVHVYLGKRYERLLFFTAPISLAALIVLIVAVASVSQKERVEGKCFQSAAKTFAEKIPELEEAWKKALPITKSEYWGSSYKLKLDIAWIYADHSRSCYRLIDDLVEEEFRQPPRELIDALELRANELLAHPIRLYGVQLPKSTTVDLLGTEIQVELDSFTRILQIVLLPVLLLWLGSIYSTRYRETVAIGRASTLLEVFPHIINMYPAGRIEAPRRRNRLAPYTALILSIGFAVVRMGLLGIFVLPPVGAYLISLYLVSIEELGVLSFLAGGVISLFCLTTLLAEVLPQHVFKWFPHPSEQC